MKTHAQEYSHGIFERMLCMYFIFLQNYNKLLRVFFISLSPFLCLLLLVYPIADCHFKNAKLHSFLQMYIFLSGHDHKCVSIHSYCSWMCCQTLV